jgi:Tfp pilus assembly protein PilN
MLCRHRGGIAPRKRIMSQQINLFNPLFRKQGFSFASPAALLFGIVIAIAIVAASAVYIKRQLSIAQIGAQVTAAAHSEAAASYAGLAAELARQKPNAAFEAEVAALEARLRGRQQIIEALNGGAVGNTEGFSNYMRAFSRQIVDGLWLTGFDITGNELALQGRTASADLVANYLKLLNQEEALRGRQFAALRISQPPPEPTPGPGAEPESRDNKSASGRREAKVRGPAPPRLLDFTISTSDILDGAQAAMKSSSNEAPLLGTGNAAPVLDAAKAGTTREAVQ